MRFLALVLLSSLAGCTCGDPCVPATDAPKCEGNVLTTCPPPGVDQLVGANRWIRKDCGSKVCVASGATALCALSAQADPACAGGVDQACESTTSTLYCSSGFATYRFPCLLCEQTDAGTSCRGGPSESCTSNAQCAAELACSPRGFCQAKDAG
jgi:hypothetical protein